MSKTSIEWTEATWNPVVGCSHISPGCDHCYAEKAAASPRLQRFERYREVITGKKWNGKTVLHEETLQQPLHWRTPRMVFADSMTDLFHESIPFETVARVVDIIRRCPQHTFQILTKREQRMHNYFHHHMRDHFPPEMQVLPNLWLGVTVENNDQRHRIEKLLQTPAAVRFISVEPMLGPADISKWYHEQACGCLDRFIKYCPNCKNTGAVKEIDWVICGGESGPRARPMHPDNPRSLRDQCAAAGIPFFFKQWGEWAPCDMFPGLQKPGVVKSLDGQHEGMVCRVGKKKAGCLLDGVEYKEYPEKKGR